MMGATSNKQQATSNKQQATSNIGAVAMQTVCGELEAEAKAASVQTK
jgi:hypothetical protein